MLIIIFMQNFNLNLIENYLIKYSYIKNNYFNIFIKVEKNNKIKLINFNMFYF